MRIKFFIFLICIIPLLFVNNILADSIDDMLSDNEISLELPDITIEGDNDLSSIAIVTIDDGMTISNLDNPMNVINTDIKSTDDEIAYSLNSFIESESIFADKRMLNFDNSIINEKNTKLDTIKAWKEIYKDNLEYEIVKKELNENFIKAISEAKATASRDYSILDENIDFYKSNNYNSVLVTFDKHSTIEDVISLIVHIKEKGMKIWLAYTGDEKLEDSVFMNPEEYANILTAASQYIDAYLLCWRRTSIHLWKQDIEFINYTCKTIRNSNENVAIFGEYYYGENSDSNGKYEMSYLYKSGLAGIVICNFGSIGRNQKHSIDIIRNISELEQCQLVGLVIGDKPGYLNKSTNKKSYSQNLNLKRKIERKFLSNGCTATLTMQNDGVENDKNDLLTTLYKNLNSR